MGKIDFDRFICHLLDKGKLSSKHLFGLIEDALAEQGLECIDGEIKEKDTKPKFKVGDWITDGNSVLHITNMDYGFYQFEDSYDAISIIDKKYRLWTIQDAKDGDVLCSGQIILLFKKWEEDNDWNFVIAYAGIDISGKLQITNGHWLISNSTQPATKEQCDLLFQKIKESGYEWDGKELKKVEQKPAEQNVDNRKLLDIVIEELTKYRGSEVYKAPWALDSTGFQYPLYFAELGVKYQKEQKPAWSEEDEKKLNLALYFLNESKQNASEEFETYGKRLSKKDYEDVVNWLKSLKDRVLPQPKQERKLSEEEKAALRTAIYIMTEERSFPRLGTHLQNILNAFEGQSREEWKPSDESFNNTSCTHLSKKEAESKVWKQ